MESGNDYVIQVKGNAKLLHRWIKNHIAETLSEDKEYTLEKQKGRIEHRSCEIYYSQPKIEGYESCQTVIHVRNWGIRAKSKYQEDHYYISNKRCSAKCFQKGIRGHWSIENNCHWVKDVILNEDKSRIKGMCLSENMSTIRQLIMNIYRLNNYKSLTKGIEKYCNRLNESLLLINRLRI